MVERLQTDMSWALRCSQTLLFEFCHSWLSIPLATTFEVSKPLFYDVYKYPAQGLTVAKTWRTGAPHKLN